MQVDRNKFGGPEACSSRRSFSIRRTASSPDLKDGTSKQDKKVLDIMLYGSL